MLELKHWLDRFEIEPYGFKIKKVNEVMRPEFTIGYHASGHVSKKELEEYIINRIQPSTIIPVHTNNPQWFQENFENVEIPKKREKIMI